MAQSLRTQESDVTLVDLLNNRFAPIQQTLMGFLDAYAEVKLRRVCKALSSLILGYRDWTTFLASFSQAPGIFAHTNLTGSASSWVMCSWTFFARTENFILNDPLLILAVPEKYLFVAVIYLEEQGYVPIPADSEIGAKHDEYHDHIYEEYTHPTRSTQADYQVNILLVEPTSSCAVKEMMWTSFDVTICYNFVTLNKAYSLFPYQTFAENTGYYMMPMIENIVSHLDGNKNREIAAAGYDLKDVAWYPEEEKSLMVRRRFGNEHS